MRRLLQGCMLLSLVAIPVIALAARGGARAERERADHPYVIGIGRELLTDMVASLPAPAPIRIPQQAPGPVDRSFFNDARGPYLPYDEVQRTAGRFPFYWTRAIYSGWGGRRGFRGGGNSWAVDFPKSDQQFLIVIKRLMRLNAY